MKKGDVLAVAAARRHHGRQTHARSDPAVPSAGSEFGRGRTDLRRQTRNAVDITATCKLKGRTGVEMEALTAVASRR